MADGPAPFTRIVRDADRVRARVAPAYARAATTGHFPDDPLLPGSALLALMVEAARPLISPAARLRRIERALFRHRVSPGDAISIDARAAGPDLVAATVLVADTVAARADVRFGPPA